MGTLGPPEALAFEDHYITCEWCAGVVEKTDRFVRAMQEASRILAGMRAPKVLTARE